MRRILLISLAVMGAVSPALAQTTFGTNLIVNGGAETGPGGNGTTPAASVPGWTRTGGADVYAYDKANQNVNALASTDIIPSSAGKNYFAGGAQPAASSFSQTINIAAGAATVDGGGVTFDLSGYLGGYGSDDDYASLSLVFLDSNGATISQPQQLQGVQSAGRASSDSGLYLAREIGPVPAGARSLKVTLTMNYVNGSTNEAYADSLALVLHAPAVPASVFGGNLILNPGADATPGYDAPNTPDLPVSQDLPNWVREAYFTSDAYLDPSADLDPQTPNLPPNPGQNYFYGGNSVVDSDNPVSHAHQDIDVSSAASVIDAGGASYTLSGWLGGYDGQGDNAVVTVTFYNWANSNLGSGQIGPDPASGSAGVSQIFFHEKSGVVPAGARYARVEIAMTRTDGENNDGLADDLSLVLSSTPSAAPVIGGVVFASAYGEYHSASPGSFIEIYGSNLAPKQDDWGSSFVNGYAPLTLDGVSVTVGGVPAYVAFVSPGQVNALIADGTPASGTVPVIVSYDGSASNSYGFSMNELEPGILAPANFNIGGKQYAAAFHADHSSVGNGHIPGVASSPAKPGEQIVFYGLGFGPAADANGNPLPLAGQLITVGNSLTNDLQFLFGSNQTAAKIVYGGMAPTYTGLYQFNVVVPTDAPGGDLPLVVKLNGTATAQTLYITVQ